eukprot:COSAG01_NODE_13129_length_1631_cov_1.573760_1_plen_51_part_00
MPGAPMTNNTIVSKAARTNAPPLACLAVTIMTVVMSCTGVLGSVCLGGHC